MNEWISVEDRLPPKDKNDKDWSEQILYCHRDMNGWWMYVGCYCFKDKHWYGATNSHSNTTHWMPLPIPPEEGK